MKNAHYISLNSADTESTALGDGQFLITGPTCIDIYVFVHPSAKAGFDTR